MLERTKLNRWANTSASKYARLMGRSAIERWTKSVGRPKIWCGWLASIEFRVSRCEMRERWSTYFPTLAAKTSSQRMKQHHAFSNCAANRPLHRARNPEIPNRLVEE